MPSCEGINGRMRKQKRKFVPLSQWEAEQTEKGPSPETGKDSPESSLVTVPAELSQCDMHHIAFDNGHCEHFTNGSWPGLLDTDHQRAPVEDQYLNDQLKLHSLGPSVWRGNIAAPFVPRLELLRNVQSVGTLSPLSPNFLPASPSPVASLGEESTSYRTDNPQIQNDAQTYQPTSNFEPFNEVPSMSHGAGAEQTSRNAGFAGDTNGFSQGMFQANVNNQVVSLNTSCSSPLLMFFRYTTTIMYQLRQPH